MHGPSVTSFSVHTSSRGAEIAVRTLPRAPHIRAIVGPQRDSTGRVARCALALALTACTLGCNRGVAAKSPAPCREDAVDDLEVAARTTGAAVKAGATTAWEGVKTGGKSAAGLVTDGSNGAKGEWNEGKHKTRVKAREGADGVREESDVPRCK